MANLQINAPVFVPSTALNHDFGDTPVGRLGNSEVRQVPSGPKRLFQAMRTAVKSLSSRIARQMKTGEARSNAEFKHSLKQTSTAAGKLLVALTKTGNQPLDLDKVDDRIQNMLNSMIPLENLGTDINKVVETRLDLHLGKLELDQLMNLRESIHEAKASDLKNDKNTFYILHHLSEAVDRAATHLLKKDCQEMLSAELTHALESPQHEAGKPGIAERCFSVLLTKSEELLKKHSLSSDDPAVMKQRKHDLVASFMDQQIVSRGGHDQNNYVGQMGSFLKLLPTKTLETLRHSGAIGGLSGDRVMSLAQGVLGNRHEESEDHIQNNAEHLLKRGLDAMEDPEGPVHSASNFANAIICLADNLKTLTHVCEVSHMNPSRGILETGAKAVNHVKNIFKDSGMNLTDLSHSQLLRLNEACRQLGIEEPRGSIGYEISTRQDLLTAQFDRQIQSLAQTMAQGSTQDILSAVVKTQQLQENLLDQFRALGEPIDDPIKGMNFRSEMMTHAMNLLSVEDAQLLHGKLVHFEMRSLADGLDDAGQRMIKSKESSKEDIARGLNMMTASKNLGLLSQASKERLLQAEVSIPPLSEGRVDGQKSLSQSSRTAIREVFKVELTGDEGMTVVGGKAPPKTQQSVIDGLNAPSPPDSTGKTQDGRGSGVASSFWRDLGRAEFEIESEDGTLTNMLPMNLFKVADESGKDELRLAASRMILDLCDGDQSMAFFITEHAHQGLLAGLVDNLNTADSPVKLPDGTPGMPYGEATPKYTFSKSKNGDIQVQVTYNIHTPQVFTNKGMNNPVMLDPTSYANFTYEVTLTQDRQVLLSKPVEMDFQMIPQ